MENCSLPVALFADRNFLPGLHGTVSSLLKNWGPSSTAEIHLFHQDLDLTELKLLEKTLELAGNRFRLHVQTISSERFRSFRSFHSNWMNYGRLLLPELMPDSPYVIYLDADLIVTTPLDALAGLLPNLEQFGIGAVPASNFEWSLDRDLCIKLGLDLSADYFNSGVLLFNLEKWRRENLSAKCFSFIQEHSTHDQGALNFVFYKAFLPLPEQFNIPIYPDTPKIDSRPGVYHFVGSPKPFDFLGNLLSKNYQLFRETLDHSAYANWQVNSLSQLARKRNIALFRSYIRAIMQSFRS